MRDSTLAIISVLLLQSAGSGLAWVASSARVTATSARAPPLAPALVLRSTVDAAAPTESSSSSSASPSTTTTTTAQADNHDNHPLQPEYAAALAQMKATLAACLPGPSAGRMLPLLEHFAAEYMGAHQTAADAHQAKAAAATAANGAATTAAATANVAVDAASAAKRFMAGVTYGVRYGMPQSPDHYTFDVSHAALRGDEERGEQYGGVDYYQFGCDFFRSCMDLTSAAVNVWGASDHLPRAVAQLTAGDNVVFFANHQSEADPQVVSACLALAGHAPTAADVIYVAGHKVTTDPLAIPFSMGRNLICIHSKKHIDADPESKPLKQKQNLKAMNALLSRLKEGGACVWVAPSGGRDRRNVATGEVPMAPFDRKTIDMFRLLGNKSKVPTHYYTLAMVSYDLCPPPDTVEAGTGETRNVRYCPVGVAVGAELESVGGLETRHLFSDTAEAQCRADYEALRAALQGQPKK